jgi:outer membrane protein
MRIVSCFILCAAALSAQSETAAPESVTLAEAVRIALQRHPDVAKAKAGAEVLKGRIREVRAQALPEVNITGGALRMRDPSFLNSPSLDRFPRELLDALNPVGANLFSYGLHVAQPLYTAGKVGTALRLARIEAEGAQLDVDRAAQDLALNVVKAYFALLWAESYERVVAETSRQREAHLEMARTLFNNGVATQVDVLRSEVAVANTRPDLVRSANAIRQARALLNYYLVRPLDFPTRAATGFEEGRWEDAEFETLAREALRRRPEIGRLRIAERSAGAMLDLARAESRFRADMTSEYGIVSRLTSNLADSRFARWSIGVNFKLPVFDGFRRSGMVYQAAANQRAAELERRRTEQQVRLALQQGLDDLKAARETVSAARASVAEAEKVLAMMQANYKYGAATTLDVVDAQTALTVARTNLLRGQFDKAAAAANLRWVMGRPPWE